MSLQQQVAEAIRDDCTEPVHAWCGHTATANSVIALVAETIAKDIAKIKFDSSDLPFKYIAGYRDGVDYAFRVARQVIYRKGG